MSRAGENYPDDWDSYWRTCPAGHRYHAADGGCQLCADIEADGEGAVCSYCGETPVMYAGASCHRCVLEQRAQSAAALQRDEGGEE